MIVGIDRGFLGQALESIIGIDADVDWGKLPFQSLLEFIPIRGCVMPIGFLMVSPPPQGCFILEEGGSKSDTVLGRYWEEFAVLFHLEEPSFQGFRLEGVEW